MGNVVVSPTSAILNVSDNITLQCDTEAGPNNTYQWMKDGVILPSETNDNLELMNINVPDNGGLYTCVVTNVAGSGNADSSITIYPIVLEDPISVNVTSNEQLTLMCNATGFPLPSIQWYQNGTLVTEDDRISISNLTDSRSVLSTLTVSVAMTNDSGDYQCNATNSAGNIVSDTVTVLVQGVCMCVCVCVCVHVKLDIIQRLVAVSVTCYDHVITFFLTKLLMNMLLMGYE